MTSLHDLPPDHPAREGLRPPPSRWPFFLGGPSDGQTVPDWRHGRVLTAAHVRPTALGGDGGIDEPEAYVQRYFVFGGRGFVFTVLESWTDEQVQEAAAGLLADALEALAESRRASL